MTNGFNSNTNIQAQAPNNAGLGKVLVSGNGKGNGAITEFCTVGIVMTVLFVFVFCVFLPEKMRADGADDAANFVFWFGVVIPTILTGYLVMATRFVASTNITVCENGITGGGAGRGYYLTFELRNFHLTYDKVVSADADGRTVTIHAGGAQYRCYAKNPAEIQRMIVEQQRKVASGV